MNNKAHLRPDDYDNNGDIIPTSWKEEKGDIIGREELKKQLKELLDLEIKRANDAPNYSPYYCKYSESYKRGYIDGMIRFSKLSDAVLEKIVRGGAE